MDEVLPVAKPHANEEYPEPIRKPLTEVEDMLGNYIEEALKPIGEKLLEYAKHKMLIVNKSIAPVLLDPNDFQLDLKGLSVAMGVGIKYQRQRLIEEFRKYGIEPRDLKTILGINFAVEPSDVRLFSILDQRENYLRQVLADTTYKRIANIINTGVEQGQTITDMQFRIMQDAGFGAVRSRVIARTETNWAVNQGTRTYIETLGVTQYNVVTAEGVEDECADVAEAGPYDISQDDILPIHPNCRCVIASVIPDEWTQEISTAKSIREKVDLLQKVSFNSSKNYGKIKDEITVLEEKVDNSRAELIEKFNGQIGNFFDQLKEKKSEQEKLEKSHQESLQKEKIDITNILNSLKDQIRITQEEIKKNKNVDNSELKELKKQLGSIKEIKVIEKEIRGTVTEERMREIANEAVNKLQIITNNPTWSSIFGNPADNQELVDYIGSHDADAWGTITGTLSDQTDLQNALNAKEPTLTKGDLTEDVSDVLVVTNGTNSVIGSGTSIEVKKVTTLQDGYLDKSDFTAIENHLGSVNNPHSTSDANLIVSDIATNNSTTLAHGFLPRLSGSASEYLNGQGNYATINTVISAPAGYLMQTFTNQTSVNIVHDFGFKPIVQVLDNSNVLIIPNTLTHNSDNDFTVTFLGSTSGTIIASAGSPAVPNVVTTAINYSVLINDYIVMATAFNITMTLPTAVGLTGKIFVIDNNSTGDIFVTGTGGELIQNALIQVIPTQSSVKFYSTGANWRAT